MKLIVSFFFIAFVTWIVYLLTGIFLKPNKKQKKNWKPLIISFGVAFSLLLLLGFIMYKSTTAPDMQCGTVHTTTSKPPSILKSATDYFLQGDYDYDTGNCEKAIRDYTKSIELNPNSAQTYNNRAYTYMRMRYYQEALPDLDKALELKPDYVEALMNRGDIHNYYYAINRQSAIADYEKVISLGKPTESSVCGHIFLARHNGWNLGTFLDILNKFSDKCK